MDISFPPGFDEEKQVTGSASLPEWGWKSDDLHSVHQNSACSGNSIELVGSATSHVLSILER